MDRERAVAALRQVGLDEEAAWAAAWIPAAREWKRFQGEPGKNSLVERVGAENDEEYFRRIGPLFFASRRLHQSEDDREGKVAAEVYAIETHFILGTDLPRDPDDDDGDGPVAVVVVPPALKAEYPQHVEFHGEEGYSPFLIHPDAIGLIKPHEARPDLTVLRLIDDEDPIVVLGSYEETKRRLGFDDDDES